LFCLALYQLFRPHLFNAGALGSAEALQKCKVWIFENVCGVLFFTNLNYCLYNRTELYDIDFVFLTIEPINFFSRYEKISTCPRFP
jgi:hypothetical protein